MTTVANTKARRVSRRAPGSLHKLPDHRFYAYITYRLGLAVLATVVIFRVTGKG